MKTLCTRIVRQKLEEVGFRCCDPDMRKMAFSISHRSSDVIISIPKEELEKDSEIGDKVIRVVGLYIQAVDHK